MICTTIILNPTTEGITDSDTNNGENKDARVQLDHNYKRKYFTFATENDKLVLGPLKAL